MLSIVALLSLAVFSIWFPGQDGFPRYGVIFFQTLLLLQMTGAFRALIRSWSGFNKYTKTILVTQALMWLAIALLHHPGFVNRDTFIMQKSLSYGNLPAWSSSGYSLIVKLIFDFDPSLFLYGLFQVFVFMSCLYRCFRIAQPKSWLMVVLITSVTAHPLMQISNFHLTRDILFALMSVYLVLSFGEKYFNRVPTTLPFLWHTVLIAFVLSCMRQDGLLYVLSFPVLAFFLTVDLTAAKKAAACVVLFAAAAFWNVSFSRQHQAQLSQKYQLTGVIHQLNYIVHKHHQSISAEQRAVIEKVVNYNYLVKNYIPQSITAFHNNHYTLPVSDEDWKIFLKTCRDLALEYPGSFLKERWDVFLNTMGLTAVPFIYANEFDLESPEGNHVKFKFKLSRWNLAPGLAALHTKYLHSIHHFRQGSAFANLFTPASLLLFFLVSVGLVIFCKSREMTAFYLISSAFCYVRLPALFILAPEPQMKYYAILLYYCAFMIILALLIRGRKVPATLAP